MAAEKNVSPYVIRELLITTHEGLALAESFGIITDASLVSALRQGLRRGRRFFLRPGPRDW